jgi:hypothetical protein
MNLVITILCSPSTSIVDRDMARGARGSGF